MVADGPLKAWRHYLEKTTTADVVRHQEQVHDEIEQIAADLILDEQAKATLIAAEVAFMSYFATIHPLRPTGDDAYRIAAARLVDQAEALLESADPREIGFR